jgi:hypothetical protein
VLAHVVGLVGDQQRRTAAAAAVGARAGRNGLVGHRHAVPVGWLAAVRIGAVRLEVDPVAGGVGGPLAADVRGRRGHDHALDASAREQLVSRAETERRLPGGGRGRREEARPLVRVERRQRGSLPRAQRAGDGPLG